MYSRLRTTVGRTRAHLLHTAVSHQVYAGLRRRTPLGEEERDRGAVSLEQVLWFVAAGVSVAVIAAILWNQIKAEAETPVQSPVSP
jgi:hypothetical protein